MASAEPLLTGNRPSPSLRAVVGVAVLLATTGAVALAGWRHAAATAAAAASGFEAGDVTTLGSALKWEEGAAMPGKRMGHQGGVNATHAFVVGGFDGKAILKTALAYDVRSRRWSALPPLPSAISDSGAAVLAGKMWALGGMEFIPGCPGAGMLPGEPGVCNVSTVLSLDLAGGSSWSPAPSMPTARRGLSIAADEARGLLYAVGGMNCKGNCYKTDIGYFDVVEAYDVAAGAWRALPPMPTPRRDLGVAVDAAGRLWVVGGCGGHNVKPGSCPPLVAVEVYDPATGAWHAPPGAQLPEARHGLLVATDGKAIFAVGGTAEEGVWQAPKPSAAAWRLDVTDDLAQAAWRRLPDMRRPRYGLNKGYGYVIDGKVYAIGGSVGGSGFLGFKPDASVEVLATEQ